MGLEYRKAYRDMTSDTRVTHLIQSVQRSKVAIGPRILEKLKAESDQRGQQDNQLLFLRLPIRWRARLIFIDRRLEKLEIISMNYL